MVAKKNIPVSYCRVIGMLFILICHIVRYYTFIPGSSVLSNVFDIGVEMFIFISGYLYGGRKIGDYKRFLRGRYLKIILPVQIWSVIMFIVSGRTSFRSFLVYLFSLQGLGRIYKGLTITHENLGLWHTWFITIIVLCYIMIPILEKMREKCDGKHIFMFLVLGWCVAGEQHFCRYTCIILFCLQQGILLVTTVYLRL